MKNIQKGRVFLNKTLQAAALAIAVGTGVNASADILAIEDAGSNDVKFFDAQSGSLPPDHAGVDVLHTYAVSQAHEIDNLIAVDASKLSGLLPSGYTMVPASALGVGGTNQGIVLIVNFEGLHLVTDRGGASAHSRVAIDVAIVVAEPAHAAEAGIDFPGAFHFYTLAMYSDDARYVASLKNHLPIQFAPKLFYQWTIDDVSGIGDLAVKASVKDSSLATFNTAFGFGPPMGPLHAIFWHDGDDGKTALHFDVPVFRQSNATSHVFTQPGSALATLLAGGGTGSCPPDPDTGFTCVIAPSLSFSFDRGDTGQLLLIH